MKYWKFKDEKIPGVFSFYSNRKDENEIGTSRDRFNMSMIDQYRGCEFNIKRSKTVYSDANSFYGFECQLGKFSNNIILRSERSSIIVLLINVDTKSESFGDCASVLVRKRNSFFIPQHTMFGYLSICRYSNVTMLFDGIECDKATARIDSIPLNAL